MKSWQAGTWWLIVGLILVVVGCIWQRYQMKQAQTRLKMARELVSALRTPEAMPEGWWLDD